MAAIDNVIADVKAKTTVEESALSLVHGIITQLAAAGDDSAKLTSLQAQLKASATALASAVEAGVAKPSMAIMPVSGPLAGGTTVKITGSGFTGVNGLMFGNNPAPSITVSPDGTSITVVTPAGNAIGPVHISVSTPGGPSVLLPTTFSYT
jgi:hypothetical protein